MSVFSHKRHKTFHEIRKHPSWFGIPFVLLIVAASVGLQQLTQTRYDLQAQRVHEVRHGIRDLFSTPHKLIAQGFSRGAAEAEEESQED